MIIPLLLGLQALGRPRPSRFQSDDDLIPEHKP
jgi:hypothetical protein